MQEKRHEARYPCVGIGLMYSPSRGDYTTDIAQTLYHAQGKDMGLSGLSFDVESPMKAGEKLVILIQQPQQELTERIHAEVRWCNNNDDGTYRIGVSMDQSLPVHQDNPGEHISIPISEGIQTPASVQMVCPACMNPSEFVFIANQEVDGHTGLMPLYDCSECGTTRTMSSLLSFNRILHASKQG